MILWTNMLPSKEIRDLNEKHKGCYVYLGLALLTLHSTVYANDVYFGDVRICTIYNGTVTYTKDIIIETTVFHGNPHTHIARAYNYDYNDYMYKLVVDDENCTDLVTNLSYYAEFEDNVELCDYPSCISNARYEDVFSQEISYKIYYVDTTIIPYFSGIDIHFRIVSEDYMYCPKALSKEIRRRNHVMKNTEVYNFLYEEFCEAEFGFIDEHSIVVFGFPISLSPSSNILHLGGTSNVNSIMFHSLGCYKYFVDYLKRFGFLAYGFYYISIRDINTVSINNSCFKLFEYQPFVGSKPLMITAKLPAMIYTQVVITIIIVIMNTIAVSAFMKRENRTSVSILFSFLGFTDGSTAICTVLVDILPYIYFHDINEGPVERIWNPEFSECITFTIMLTVKSALHMSSVLLTMLLCILRATAILFPFKSRFFLTKKVWTASAVSICFGSMTLFSFIFKDELKRLKNEDGYCFFDNSIASSAVSNSDVYIYSLAFVIIIVSTVYMCCKMLCFQGIGKQAKHIQSDKKQRKMRRSVALVIVICIVFIASEGINVYLIISWLITRGIHVEVIGTEIEFQSYISYRYDDDIYSNTTLFHYLDLSILLGFSFNFIAYLTMGSHIRKLVYNQMKCLCCFR